MNLQKTCNIGLLVLSLIMTSGYLAAESSSPSPTPNPSPTPSPEPSVVASPVSPNGSPLIGTWKVERAVFELFGSLKDVTGQDERFYSQIRLDAGSKGGLRYGNKPEEAEIEYDIKNGQSLTLAFGSRLKPQVDLYNLLILADGSLFLRSTRLATVNGTVIYLCRKVN